MGLFVVLCVPTALVNDVPGFLVLRFLQGFFGSPCLATGGASLGDIFSLLKLPYALCVWAAFATCGPALGPIVSGFSVPAENWHWSLWEILWIAGPVFLSMMIALPETSSPNILTKRAKRLRKLTGDQNLKSQGEIDQAKMTPGEVAFESLYRPLQIMILDPAVLFTNLYTSLVYGIFYSFFEVFPIVYIGDYGFNLGEMGLTFLSITAAVIISGGAYVLYLKYVFEPEIMTKGPGQPERRLVPALFASLMLPVGLFIFAWTSRAVRFPCLMVELVLIPPTEYPLDSLRDRDHDLRLRRLRLAAMHLHLHPHVLSTVCGIHVRGERFRSIGVRQWGDIVLQTTLHQPGSRARCQLAWRPDCGMHCGHIRSLLLWSRVASEVQVRGEVGSAGIVLQVKRREEVELYLPLGFCLESVGCNLIPK